MTEGFEKITNFYTNFHPLLNPWDEFLKTFFMLLFTIYGTPVRNFVYFILWRRQLLESIKSVACTCSFFTALSLFSQTGEVKATSLSSCKYWLLFNRETVKIYASYDSQSRVFWAKTKRTFCDLWDSLRCLTHDMVTAQTCHLQYSKRKTY